MTDSQAARMKLLLHKVGASPALAGKKHCPQCVKCFFFSQLQEAGKEASDQDADIS